LGAADARELAAAGANLATEHLSMRGGRRVRCVGLALLSATALLVLVASDLPPRFLVVEDPPESADAALVMSGDLNFDRTRAAALLVLDGKARLLVLTGGAPWGGDSAESLRDFAVKAGVPLSRIRYENTSLNTRDSVVNVQSILRREGVKTVVLVTSPSHQRRSFLAARRALPGIRIVNRPVRKEPWPPARPWWADARTRGIVAREYLKLAYYGLRGWL
jgi:uncharacterized SAM-binding protein YcdF (DUF218 family)